MSLNQAAWIQSGWPRSTLLLYLFTFEYSFLAFELFRGLHAMFGVYSYYYDRVEISTFKSLVWSVYTSLTSHIYIPQKYIYPYPFYPIPLSLASIQY